MALDDAALREALSRLSPEPQQKIKVVADAMNDIVRSERPQDHIERFTELAKEFQRLLLSEQPQAQQTPPVPEPPAE